jgi:enoyl-CoA hydratase/carnithine racemase
LIDRPCRGRYPYAIPPLHSNQKGQANVAEAGSTTKTIDLDVPDNEVLYSTRDRVATVTLNRPERMNATNLTLPYSVSKGMRRAATDPEVRVIVLTGAGKAFCAGADRQRLEAGKVGAPRPVYPPDDPAFFQEISSMLGPDLGGEFMDVRRYSYFMRIGKPIIAALNGAAAGGGMIPALCADIRLAADTMFFTTSFAQRGLIAEHGISWLLPRLVGPSRALEMLMTARRIGAHEAEAMGLVNKVFPHATFRDDVQAYAVAIARTVSPRSLAVMKAQVWKAMAQSFRDALATADVQLELSVKTSDYIEGVSHFLEKRAANFPDLDPDRG